MIYWHLILGNTLRWNFSFCFQGAHSWSLWVSFWVPLNKSWIPKVCRGKSVNPCSCPTLCTVNGRRLFHITVLEALPTLKICMLWCFLLSAPLRMLWNQHPFYIWFSRTDMSNSRRMGQIQPWCGFGPWGHSGDIQPSWALPWVWWPGCDHPTMSTQPHPPSCCESSKFYMQLAHWGQP